MLPNVRVAAFALGVANGVVSTHAHAQRLEREPVTVSYAAIGPVTFTPAPGIKAILAAPRINGGVRVICTDVNYKCDIGVSPRTIGYYSRPSADLAEEVRNQFQNIAEPPPKGALMQTVSTSQGVEVTFINHNAEPKARYTTIALVLRGPVLLSVFAQGPDSATVASMLNIARNVKAQRAHEVVGEQFAHFVSICNDRVPDTRAMNERARASSPFNDNVLLGLARQRDTTMTAEKLRAMRSQQYPQVLSMYDQLKPTNRQTFCSDLPKVIAAAQRELRAL